MNALRLVRPVDSSTLLRWRNQPEVARYMFTDHVISPEEHEAWFARALSREDAYYWIITADGEDVGMVSVTDIDRRHGTGAWAFYIAEEVRGRGIGAFTEYTLLNIVFDELGLRKLIGEVLVCNPQVLAMHERFGFVCEGVLRAHVLKGGEALDVYRIGILREEWAGVREIHRAALLEKGIAVAS
jgi:UDP-4-amino-4,6-dideoxy-N-acetyl-beta-L-altrosamine N-acetyltransferase